MMTKPAAARAAHGGEIHWFGDYTPGHVLGVCPHHECPHNATDVIAWGPDLTRYELVECRARGGCDGRCRAWIDHRARVSTAWLTVDGGRGAQHRLESGLRHRPTHT